MRVMHIVSKQADTGGDAAFASSYLYQGGPQRPGRRDAAQDAPARNRPGSMPRSSAPAVTLQDPERVAASRQIGRGIQDCLVRCNATDDWP